MRPGKSISLLIIYSLLMLTLGFWGGVKSANFFYPGNDNGRMYLGQNAESREQEQRSREQESPAPETVEVTQREETLSVETEYVLEETDILRETVEETVQRLPGKYVGMNREQFLDAMRTYESSPPLSELERGFVSLEVLAFSRKRVVVQMNYRYLQPGESYYLAVMDNEVVVYLEDMRTVYINTGIMMDTLPQSVQDDLIQIIPVEDEGKLYSFLETYSS